MYLIGLLMFFYILPLSTAQQECETSSCISIGSLCECSGLTCIPASYPCEQGTTTEIVFVRSFILRIPKDAFVAYDVTFLTLSGIIGVIEPGAFNRLDRLQTLRINSFSISASSKSWPSDIDNYISYSSGLIGLQSVDKGILNSLPSLTSLDFSFNRIENVNVDMFSELVMVEEIGLAGNAINTFDENKFKHVLKLKKLYLSKNSISHLVFATNSSHSLFEHLEKLDLFGNGLTTFPSFILEKAPDVLDIDLRENPLVCDCNMIDFLEKSRENQQIFGIDPTCKSPVKKCSAPKISSPFSKFDVLPGESMVLAFEVRGQPHPFVSILGPDGQPRVGQYNINTNQVIVDLYVENDDDFGIYSCNAKNSYGSASFDVVIERPPSEYTTTRSAQSRSSSGQPLSYSTSLCLLILTLQVFNSIFVRL